MVRGVVRRQESCQPAGLDPRHSQGWMKLCPRPLPPRFHRQVGSAPFLTQRRLEPMRLSSRRTQRKRESTWQRMRRSEEHTSELQSRFDLVCRLLLEKKKKMKTIVTSLIPMAT